jgi:adenylyltransferase/sulfurtransferase
MAGCAEIKGIDERYLRQILLPEVGVEGQRRLAEARVLLVGLGGLGSPLALYLAAAGVGTLGLVEDDCVQSSNLHRQVLFGAPDLGLSKLEQASARLEAAYPGLSLERHPYRIQAENALELVSRYDLVADGSDNFPTRFAVADACALLKKPYVFGSVLRFEGQVGVFLPDRGPCFRCLFREPPPPGAVPSCAEAGVLGVLPGVIGALQALQVLMLLLGVGEPLVGRLLVVDGLRNRFHEVQVPRDPKCPLCGPAATIHKPVSYESICKEVDPAMWHLFGPSYVYIGVKELWDRLQSGVPLEILDVREPWEAELRRIPGSRLIPLGQLKDRLEELNRKTSYVVHCHVDGRARQAAKLLLREGFSQVEVLEGGIVAWEKFQQAQANKVG